MNKKTIYNRIEENWKSGLTVALVSLPLGIALSIASGATPTAGVITGIWAACIASALGGSKFNIVGAAGALTTLLAAYALQYSPLLLPLVAIGTGIIILLVYALKLEKYLIYIPNSVMYGFAAGVAILIAVGQINDAFGLSGITKHPHFFENLRETITHLHTFHIPTALLFFTSIIALRTCRRFLPKFPGVVLVAGIGIIIGYTSNIFTTLSNKFPQGVSGEIINIPTFSSVISQIQTASAIGDFIKICAVIALVAVLETLITAKLGDKMTKTTTNARKELRALGIANLASGLFGGLPATGVFIRTGLNIKSGAKDNMSGILSACFTALLALLFMPYFKYIPMATIAAILCNVAIGLIEIDHFKHYWHKEKKSFVVAVIVVCLCLLEDPSIAIIVGAGVALLLFIDNISKGQFELFLNKDKKIIKRIAGTHLETINEDTDVVVYSFEGIISYINIQAHKEHLSTIVKHPKITHIVLRLRDVFYLDDDALESLEDIVKDVQEHNKTILFTSANEQVANQLKEKATCKTIPLYTKTKEALHAIGFETEDIGNRQLKTT